jgi:hypothetical protein
MRGSTAQRKEVTVMAHAGSRFRVLCCAVVAVLAMALCPAPSHAEVSAVPADTAGLGGATVYDLAVLPSGRVVLGGDFTSVGGLARRNVGALLASGNADAGFVANTDGQVNAVVASADGSRVFIGGTFTQVNGVPRHNLAALNAATGAVITGWQADATGGSESVKTLAVSGNRLYVGGSFNFIDGAHQEKLAAVDVSNGSVLHWSTWVNGAVHEVRVAPGGSTVWVGGAFTKVRGQNRPYIAGIDASSGVPTGFVASNSPARVVSIALSRDGQWLYAGNDHNRVLAYQPAQSNSVRWLRAGSGNTQAMAVSDSTVYLGGHFRSFDDGSQRMFFAAVNRLTGALTSWNPNATAFNRGTWALVIDGNHLHAGGGFTQFNGVKQRLYARFDGSP